MRQPVALCGSLLSLSVCALLGSAGAAGGQGPAPQRVAQGVVIVCDGSGDYRTLSAGLACAVTDAGLPLYVETFVWSHGRGRVVRDHADHRNHVAKGAALAERVCAWRRCYPGLKIYLAAHSAGNAVVLAAAERLPPNTVDRIVLLAPSVSPGYDLRPALASSREGIDAFCSDRDRFVLDVCMRIVGTADGGRGPAAGRVGFRPVVCNPGDAALYTRLRQHTWHPTVSWTGHAGGHYGNNRACFVSAYVLPLFLSR
jgi:pimeloyl-ACP methyl ester carboxylesterase